ncbi:EAL domain-containing protein [Pseudoalteromonas sp. SSM20]|uniref:EAL domain-containing protein n=1 Tax=Pseudoalteromonas sp. SSM20 TaxID=3139394 RepID=UPI003BACBE6C
MFTPNKLVKVSDDTLKHLSKSSFHQIERVNNLLFLATDNQLLEYNLENPALETRYSEHVSKLASAHNQLFFISKGRLLNYQSGWQKPENLTAALSEFVLDYQIVNDHTFWLTTSSNKLLYFEKTKNIKKTFNLSNPIKSLFIDRKNRLWFTQNKALYFISPSTLEIETTEVNIEIDAIYSIGGSSLLLESKGDIYQYHFDIGKVNALNLSLVSNIYPLLNGDILLKHQNTNWYLTSLNALNITPSKLENVFREQFSDYNFEQIQWHGEYFYLQNKFGLWRYHIASNQLSHLIQQQNIEHFYLNNQGELWFSDAQYIYTFDLKSHQQQTKFPFTHSVALIGDGKSPPFVVTTKGIYRNTGDVTFAFFNTPQHVGEIVSASFYNGLFFLATNNGFWQIKKTANEWHYELLFKNTVHSFTHQQERFIWLHTDEQVLLFDIELKQVAARFDTTAFLHSSFNFYYDKQHFVKDNQIFSYPVTNSAAIYPLTGLAVREINLNQQSSHLSTDTLVLTQQETNIVISLFDNDIPANAIALSYRFSVDMPWVNLPQGQDTIALLVNNKALQQISIYNRNGLTQQPISINFSHNYFQLNAWQAATLLLLFSLFIISFLWWFKHRKDAQYGLTSALLAQTQEAVWISDEALKVLNVNKTFYTITGFSQADVKGKQLKVFDGESRNTKLEQIIKHAIKDKGSWSGEIWSKRKNAELIAISLNITKIKLPSKLGLDTEIHYVGMFKDITQQKQQEKQLRDLATRDRITGLLNRTVFIEQLNLAINASSSNQPEFCVLIINLDNFYKINDALGHSYGDRVLKMAAQRLEQTISPNFTLASLGGDEFGILLPPHVFTPLNIFNIKRLCEKLLSELSRTMLLDDLDLCLSASIGAAIYPDNGYDSESILRSADSALQHAKSNGKNTFQIFNRAVKTHSPASLSIENEINRAIVEKEFILYYQPKFNTRTNQICGVEALARWPDGNQEIRSPAQFISVAEANNAIIPLTRVLIEVCCQQIKQWQQKGVKLNGRVALNLSAIHFQRSDLIEDLTNYLQKYQISGDTMELEITESVMMNDPEFALQQMLKLKRLGFTIALDDFGTGHSSLSYLKQFPIDRLKIDRSFVIDIEKSEQDRNITATIIRLAKYLNIDVVAEGVETEAQSYFLHVMGCDVVQGYFFSKPLPCDQLEKFIEQTKVLINHPKSN